MKRLVVLSLLFSFGCGVNINNTSKWGYQTLEDTHRLEDAINCPSIEDQVKICTCYINKVKEKYDPIDIESSYNGITDKQIQLKKELRDFTKTYKTSECDDLKETKEELQQKNPFTGK